MLKKLLIIEDEEYLSEMYKICFESSGYEIVIAENGEDGLQLAKKERPDLILLDIMLPKMNGYQVLEELRRNPETKDLKVFFLSNLGQNSEIRKGIEVGADGYFIKSNLTPSQLVKNIDKFFTGEIVGEAKPESNMQLKKASLTSNQAERKLEHEYRILMIEGNEGLIEMYSMQFAKNKIKLDVAKNGAWGLKMARQNAYDAIIMDMVMPAMNGYSALKQLKSDEKTRDIPVVLLSNSAQDKDIEKAMQLGAADFLLKSRVTPVDLVKHIIKLIKH
jgi:CheY-like chemotaxis protein